MRPTSTREKLDKCKREAASQVDLAYQAGYNEGIDVKNSRCFVKCFLIAELEAQLAEGINIDNKRKVRIAELNAQLADLQLTCETQHEMLAQRRPKTAFVPRGEWS